MAKIQDIDVTSLLFQEGSAPATPASTKWRLYTKTTGLFYKDDAGVETGPLAAASGGLGNHGARVFHSTTQSLASGGIILFDSERWDTDAYHSTVTNTGRLTIPSGQDGIYSIVGNAGWDANTTGYRALDIRLNGATLIGREQVSGQASIVFTHHVMTIYSLVATDYVELIATQNSGANRTIQQIANVSPEFMLQRLA